MKEIFLIAVLFLLSITTGCSENNNSRVVNQTALGVEHELILVFDRPISVAQILEAQKIDPRLRPVSNSSSLQSSLNSRGFLKISLATTDVDDHPTREFDVLLYPARGFEVGQIVMVDGERQTVAKITYDADRNKEILTLANGKVVPCGWPEKLVTFESFAKNANQNFFSLLDEDFSSLLLEFMYPEKLLFEETYGYAHFQEIEKNLSDKEKGYVRLAENFLAQSARQFEKYDMPVLEKDPFFSYILLGYRLFLVKAKYHLNVVTAPFDTLYGLLNVEVKSPNVFFRFPIPQQVGSIQTSFTLPSIIEEQFHSDIWSSQGNEKLARSLYAAFILQWTEPLWIATRISGNLEEGLQEGARGSYRLLHNSFTSAGGTPLRVCGLALGEMPARFCLDRAQVSSGRYGFVNQCYLNQLGNRKPFYQALSSFGHLDLKGKTEKPNILDYDNGFEYRIFGNQPIENFTATLEIISLLIAHAETTFYGRKTQELDYVNMDDDFLAKSEQCKSCQENGFPCNAWQLAMASVFDRGYRAVMDLNFIQALERNLALSFWPDHGAKKAFAFEVAEKLVAELYRRYKDHPMVQQMMGYRLKEEPPKQRLSLQEWSFYFNDTDAPWSVARKELLSDLKSMTGHSMKKEDFLNQVVSKYFDKTWANAYDDILFALEAQGFIKLFYQQGSIVSLEI